MISQESRDTLVVLRDSLMQDLKDAKFDLSYCTADRRLITGTPSQKNRIRRRKAGFQKRADTLEKQIEALEEVLEALNESEKS